MSAANIRKCICPPAFIVYGKKQDSTSYDSHGEIESIYCVGCNICIKYVCTRCNRSYTQKREFKRVECSGKNELGYDNRRCPSGVLNLEQGSADDTSLNRHGSGDDLNWQQHISFDTHPPRYDRDANETYCAITHSKDIDDIIEKTNWGSEQSMKYFQKESKLERAGITSLVSNATKQLDLTSNDVDYHLLGAALCNNMPRKKLRLMASFLKVTIERVQRDQPVILSHPDFRRCYTEGTNSIYVNMPVPRGISGGEAYDNFAIVSVEHAVNHLLGHGVPLKTLKLNNIRDWKNSSNCFHSLFHKDLYDKLQKTKECPENLRIHLLYIWSDGFQKNTLVKTKKTSMQLFIIYILPPDGVRDIARYTIPFALGIKQKDHQRQLIEILKQTKDLERVINRYCKDSNSCEPTYFERVIVQNDQIERVNNLSIIQGGTYGKQVGYSNEFHQEVPSCRTCFTSRFLKLFPSTIEEYIPDSSGTFNKCVKCSDWWLDPKNTTGWLQKPHPYPTVSSTNLGTLTSIPPQGREITYSTSLPPCKISFQFLLQAYEYAKYQYLCKDGWTQAMTRNYLRTCCMSGDVVDNFFKMANEFQQNQASFIPPELWRRHEELGIQIEHFPDAPMHMIFLGVTKHLLVHVVRLFGNKNANYRKFSGIISEHIKFGKDMSIDWCPIAEFSENESISTSGWQSAQYVAFSRLSLVYFGLVEDFEDIDNQKLKAFQQVFVLWFLLISTLFTENICNSQLVDEYVRLFLSSCVCFGAVTRNDAKSSSMTKGKRNKDESVFFRDTSNYFSLLNLKHLIDRFGSPRNLWEGEREKFIKYVKAEMNTICQSETYMSGVLNNLLRTHCLHNFMRDNHYYHEQKTSKTRDFKIYKSRKALMEDFVTGKFLSGVIVKDSIGTESIHLCYEEKNRCRLVLEKLNFNDEKGRTKFNLYYAPILLSEQQSKNSMMTINDRDNIHRVISGYVIIHPMVTIDKRFRISNGHTVLTQCWRIRTEKGLCDFVPRTPGDFFVFVDNK
jgi:hypothetical protein